jgi:acid phosphatase (class A)
MKQGMKALALGAAALLGYQGIAQTVVHSTQSIPAEDAIKAARASLGAGYLSRDRVPDSQLYLPPPPPKFSAALWRDKAANRKARKLRGTARWDLAAADAEILAPADTAAMSCAAGLAIGPTETPAIQKIMRRSMADLGLATFSIKKLYARKRPFMVNKKPICSPKWDAILRKDGSYPSGHSAIGFGWGLILAEILPDRAAQLVARGRAFGDSRRVCNVHWLSDVEEGRIAASAMVARLHGEQAFRDDLEAARAEAKALTPIAPNRDCAAESAALALTK